jgi:hypothetical protein
VELQKAALQNAPCNRLLDATAARPAVSGGHNWQINDTTTPEEERADGLTHHGTFRPR